MFSSNLDFPATTNISNLVSTKLWFKYPDQSNYQVWKLQMIRILHSHGLLGFVDGSSVVPINGEVMSTDCMIWRQKCEELVKGWILSSCTKDVVSLVATLKTAKDVWLGLERMSKNQIYINPSASWVNGSEWEKHLALQQAVMQGDWEKTIQIFRNDDEAMKAGLDDFKSTALHIAVGTGQTVEFLNKLVQKMPYETIAQKTVNGDTALSMAAALGNTKAARVLVKKMPSLLYVPNNQMDFPVQTAAKYAQADVFEYLISVDRLDYSYQNPYTGLAGLRLLVYVIDAGFFDIALELVQNYPDLAKLKLPNDDSALRKLAENKWAFYERDVSKLDRLILFVFSKSPKWLWKRKNGVSVTPAIVSRIVARQSISPALRHRFLLQPKGGESVTLAKVPRIKAKQSPSAAKQLVEKLCNELKHRSTPEEALKICYDAFLMATKSGATYVAQVIEKTFPGCIYSSMDAHISILHVAIENRSLDILKLIYTKSCHRHLYSDWMDMEGNNLLHLAAKLIRPDKIKVVQVAVLQMLQELDWYTEVRELLHPFCGDRLNKAGKTPGKVFREEHMKMKVEGEKWLKEMSSFFIIVSTLIATVTFAAAITVPGGTNDSSKGFPVFSKQVGFIIFAISDVVSLCSAVFSVLLFLAMYTTLSSYTRSSSFHPYIVRAGMLAVIISVISMMVAISAAAYLVFGKHSIWIPILSTCFEAYAVLVFFASTSNRAFAGFTSMQQY